MNLLIRRAMIEDLEAILLVYKRAIENISTSQYNQDQKRAWLQSISNKSKWTHRLQSQYFLVAEIESEIAGFSSLDNEGLIDVMYVDPKHQKQGVAHILLKHLEIEAQNQELSLISTYASKAAVDFFKKNGFLQISENHVQIQDQSLTNYILKKEL